jgi:hypothetical protein
VPDEEDVMAIRRATSMRQLLAVARLIQQHVAAKYARVERARPIHQRNPLFRERFAHAAQIEMRQAAPARGVRPPRPH